MLRIFVLGPFKVFVLGPLRTFKVFEVQSLDAFNFVLRINKTTLAPAFVFAAVRPRRRRRVRGGGEALIYYTKIKLNLKCWNQNHNL